MHQTSAYLLVDDNDSLRGTGNKSSIISMALFNLPRQINHLFSSYDSQKFDSSNDSQIFSLCLACYRTQNKFICLISLSNFHTVVDMHIIAELPSGKLISDGWRCLELFSNPLHQTINLCTCGYDGKWSVHYVRHGTGLHHRGDRGK